MERSPKRQRTLSTSAAPTHSAPVPGPSQQPRRLSGSSASAPAANPPASYKGKERANPLAGFDDTEDLPDPAEAGEGEGDAVECPLCLGKIEQLIYNIRGERDFQTLYLQALPSPDDSFLLPYPSSRPNPVVPRTLPRHALYGRRRDDDPTWREHLEERAVERRRYVYREGLYAKHIASNRYTRFKPVNAHSFATNPDLKNRCIKFIRRELQCFPNVDVSFLTTYLMSIASQLDLRSLSAIRLISDFLTEEQAAHLVHEICTFARSPFTSLEAFDRVVQPRSRSSSPRLEDTSLPFPIEDIPAPDISPTLSNELERIKFKAPKPKLPDDDDDAISLYAGESDFSYRPTPQRATTPTTGFSIFGAARRASQPVSKPTDADAKREERANAAEARKAVENGNRIVEAQAGPKPSSTLLNPDLRLKLQARLTAEYRATVAKNSKVSDLRAKLRLKLSEEKALATAVRQDEDAEWEDYQPNSTVYNAETRRLLLDRLEEEKRLASGEGDGSPFLRGEEFVVQPMYDEPEEEVKVDVEAKKKEEMLKAALARRRVSNATTTSVAKPAATSPSLESRAAELKERLLRAKAQSSKTA
ncbi:RING finger domain protein [Pseudohyphozyma bogoriensis]|nr:RING finger domain protein [Pseudohyphozyma bogoriensis]